MNKDYVMCHWCKLNVKRVYGKHMKFHHIGKTSADYKKEFPGEPLTSISDRENTAKNSGKHMKEEKWRSWAKERITGKNNPNHKSKTTDEERKSRSPFSQSFISYKNAEDKKLMVSIFVKMAIENRLTETQLEYWINKCDTIEEAKHLYHIRQQTFSLETCIQKYGEYEGKLKWKDRQKRWVASLHENFRKCGDGRSFQSKWAKEIIEKCCKYLEIEVPSKEKWMSSKNREHNYSYDFTYGNKIIEFNGDFWHANPSIFEETEMVPVKNETAKNIWANDEIKINLAKENGYDVLIVWESEYKKNPTAMLKKCKTFIDESYN